MVNTRSGSGVDQPPVIRQGRDSSSGSAAQPAQMDPAMQQFFQNQMQLLENLTNIVANLQA
jgi:hypothetical protein